MDGWNIYLRNLLFGLLLFNLFPCTFFYKREKRRNFSEGEKSGNVLTKYLLSLKAT